METPGLPAARLQMARAPEAVIQTMPGASPYRLFRLFKGKKPPG